METPLGCRYIGRLQNSPSSSVAVTGCLNKPDDKMEVTMISDRNFYNMFSVDFSGNTEVIKNPLGKEGYLYFKHHETALRIMIKSLGKCKF